MLPMILAIENDDDRRLVEGRYLKYSKKLYLIAKKILNNHQDAEDSVNDTIAIVIENLDRFKTDDEEYLIKLLVICCRNAAIAIYRKNKSRAGKTISLTSADPDDERGDHDIRDDGSDVDKPVLDGERCELMRKLIDQLDLKYRDVIVLKYYYMMSNDKIAEIMKITEALVRMRLTRAKRILLEKGGDALYDAYHM